MRVLYVLNSMGGGASLGIYEMLKCLPRKAVLPFAVVPPGTAEQEARVRALFEDVLLLQMPWWNHDVEAGAMRRVARAVGRWRRGITEHSTQSAIEQCIRRWSIDVVHTGTALNRGGALAAQALGIPHIWHVKEEIGEQGRVHFPMPDAELTAYMTDLADQVVVMSNFIGQIFRQHDCTGVKVLPDGVDLMPYRDGTSQNLRAQLGLRAGEYLVGMVASMTSAWKRHEVFIEMAGHLARQRDDVHFVAIGPRPSATKRWPHDQSGAYYQRLVALARACVPAGRLTFLDFVPAPPDIMRSIDVLVHTCDVEPFGRIAIEAMAAGTPVVGPATGGIAETVIDGETGLLVPPGNPKAFSKAVDTLLADDNLRAGMGAAGRQHVCAHYTIEQHNARIQSIYQSLLEA